MDIVNLCHNNGVASRLDVEDTPHLEFVNAFAVARRLWGASERAICGA
jgi:hypothetical protein